MGMTKTNKSFSKLSLGRETLRNLKSAALNQAAGGLMANTEESACQCKSINGNPCKPNPY
jgi:hypothetical protein